MGAATPEVAWEEAWEVAWEVAREMAWEVDREGAWEGELMPPNNRARATAHVQQGLTPSMNNSVVNRVLPKGNRGEQRAREGNEGEYRAGVQRSPGAGHC